ncbi:Unknown protein, partial [Striga hermonthica]
IERAFWDLTQGTDTVEDYEQNFTCMSAFAPHMVDTDLKKASKDWPKGCGPRAKLKPRRHKTKRARRQGKAKAKEEKCWCKPCSRKRRVRKMDIRRRGMSRIEDGWIWRAGDCIGLDGWDPWPSGELKGSGEQLESVDDKGASTSEERASCHDARDKVGHTAS